jgi:hypothetical protein
MPNPYRSQRERAAYETGFAAGLAAGRAESTEGPPKTLTREQVRAMGIDETNRRWPEVQAALKAGLPSEEDVANA